MKSSKFSMQFFTGNITGRYSFFERFETANSVRFFMQTYSHSKFIFSKSYALMSNAVVRSGSLVAFVLRQRAFSKIAPPVIRRLHVFVVHKMRWPLFCFQKPRYVMGHMRHAVYHYLAVALCGYVSSRSSGATGFPNQVSSFRGVGKDGADVRKCQALALASSLWFSKGSHSILLRSGRSEAGWSVCRALLPRFSSTSVV